MELDKGFGLFLVRAKRVGKTLPKIEDIKAALQQERFELAARKEMALLRLKADATPHISSGKKDTYGSAS